MSQRPLRIFVGYAGSETQSSPIFQRFMEDLRAEYAEVVADESNRSETEMLNALQRCDYFILFQSQEALLSSSLAMITAVAIALIQQGLLQGVRFVIFPIAPDELPGGWATLPTIDATQDYNQARTQLMQFLARRALQPRVAVSSVPTSSSPSLVTPLRSSASFASFPSPPVSSTAKEDEQSPLFDQNTTASFLPPKPSVSPRMPLPTPFPWRVVIIIGLIVLIIGAPLLLSALFSRSVASTNNPASPPFPMPKFAGTAYFTSSNILNATATQGVNDGIQMDLALAPPRPGDHYYAWLLPDVSHVESAPRLLGQFSSGNIHASYQDPMHRDLLAAYSRFCITEEALSTVPDLPSPDTSTWLYFAALPQKPSPSDMNHYSLLDHLRHLLVSEPHLAKLGIQAGLSHMLLFDTRKILEWASAARGIGRPQDPDLMHRHFIRILDFLDGPNVQKDLPQGTPVLAGDPFGLLTLDPTEDPPGYVQHVDMHMQALSTSPGATLEQQTLARGIDAALNGVKGNLGAVQKDAKTLFSMSNAQLLDPKTVPLLDDLVNRAEDAYIGNLDVQTGRRRGGVIWITDQTQHVAQFALSSYIEDPSTEAGSVQRDQVSILLPTSKEEMV